MIWLYVIPARWDDGSTQHRCMSHPSSLKEFEMDLLSSLQTGFDAENHSLWPQVWEQVDVHKSTVITAKEDLSPLVLLVSL